MQITKLANYTVTTSINQTFAIEINENRNDDGRVSYTVAFTDLSADSAWSDSFIESFETAEFADAYVQEWVDKNACKEIVPELTVVIDSATSTTETGIIHEYTLRRCVSVWRTGYIDANYEVVHEWGEMKDGSICNSDHGYDVFERDNLTDARELFGGFNE